MEETTTKQIINEAINFIYFLIMTVLIGVCAPTSHKNTLEYLGCTSEQQILQKSFAVTFEGVYVCID